MHFFTLQFVPLFRVVIPRFLMCIFSRVCGALVLLPGLALYSPLTPSGWLVTLGTV